MDPTRLGELAHELRNALAPLRNALAVLDHAEAAPEAHERARAAMARQLEELERLVSALGATAATRLAEAPSAAGVPTDDQAAATTSATPRARRRILVADDQALVRDSLAELLATEEHEVRTAADGAQAIDIAAVWHPHVVLLDVYMPGLSGLDAARRLRALEGGREMTLFMLSGMEITPAWAALARDAGFDDCLDKAASPQQLLERLRRL